jgi:prepilin-type N-terminal cleavage/methylation domain-containing protein
MTARSRRRGYTLFEIILVLAILVIAAALSYPSLRSSYGYYKLQGGVDAVRSAWAHARARAIEEGRPYRFAVESGGRHFRVAPDHPDYWSGGDAPADDANGKGMVLEQALPSGVRFTVNGEPSATPPNDGLDREETTPSSGDWSPAVVFLPDGTAPEDVRIVFQIKGVKPTSVHLRGLTGTVTVQTLQ